MSKKLNQKICNIILLLKHVYLPYLFLLLLLLLPSSNIIPLSTVWHFSFPIATCAHSIPGQKQS